MLATAELSPEARQALITCYRIAAARGRQLRMQARQAVPSSSATTAQSHDDGECLAVQDAAINPQVAQSGESATPALGDSASELPDSDSRGVHAQVDGRVYNPSSRSNSPHESMDHHDGGDRDQRIPSRVSV